MSKISERQREELLAAVNQPDETIDLSDIPEIVEIPANAVRGKFYKGDAALRLPIYLDAGIQNYLIAAAERKGKSLGELVNELLTHEIAIAESIK
jgi:hypothetical protein